ncbi:hypothetical protein C8Q73DRAFT_783320 [Cubamyces lactineus]|nr:hypothetical protein C8Q73DRAFT_783320 [Cubamyces lactineus]
MSDMCTPIFPNTSHPTGREPLKPEPEGLFPYDNCYHWFAAKLVDVRIKSRAEEFDETNAVALSVLTRIQMVQSWEQDNRQTIENCKTLHPAGPTEIRSPLEDVQAASQAADAEFEEAEASSLCSARSSHLNHSLDDLAAMDIFSGPNDDVDLVPLVDLWISELGDHLKQEDIPDPQEMYAEFDHIAKIIKEARIRSYAALTAPAQAPDDESSIEHPEECHRRAKPNLKIMRSAKSWGKRAKRLSSRLGRLFFPPYLLLWP